MNLWKTIKVWWQRRHYHPRMREQPMVTRSMIAGENLTAGSIIYLKPDQQVYAMRPLPQSWIERLLRKPKRYPTPIGIALAAVPKGQLVQVGVAGRVTVRMEHPYES